MPLGSLLEKLRFETLLAVPARWLYRLRFRKLGAGSFVSPFIQGIGLDSVSVGEGSRISRNTRLLALHRYGSQHFSPRVEIGNDVSIGFGCTLSCVNALIIGDHVTIGDNVYIADSQHGYAAPGRGILSQPLVPGAIRIGDGAWIGYGAFVAGEVEIGEHSIVGANSVVTRSVPPYTIVAGAPARPIRRFDRNSNHWLRVDSGPAQTEE
jgi:acetyltransferase-like isoleucine patch superfamily enzyme